MILKVDPHHHTIYPISLFFQKEKKKKENEKQNKKQKCMSFIFKLQHDTIDS